MNSLSFFLSEVTIVFDNYKQICNAHSCTWDVKCLMTFLDQIPWSAIADSKGIFFFRTYICLANCPLEIAYCLISPSAVGIIILKIFINLLVSVALTHWLPCFLNCNIWSCCWSLVKIKYVPHMCLWQTKIGVKFVLKIINYFKDGRTNWLSLQVIMNINIYLNDRSGIYIILLC